MNEGDLEVCRLIVVYQEGVGAEKKGGPRRLDKGKKVT